MFTEEIQEPAGPETGVKLLYSSGFPQTIPKAPALRPNTEWLTLNLCGPPIVTVTVRKRGSAGGETVKQG